MRKRSACRHAMYAATEPAVEGRRRRSEASATRARKNGGESRNPARAVLPIACSPKNVSFVFVIFASRSGNAPTRTRLFFAVGLAARTHDAYTVCMNIQLVNWSADNKAELVRMCNAVDRAYLSERMPYPYTETDADWWLNNIAENEGTNGVFRAIVADGAYVGNISVEEKSDVYTKDAEIGYFLVPDYWNNGIMTHAVSTMCSMAFSALDIMRITGLVYEPNTASRRVLEKNGFALEGIMKNAVYKNGAVYNLCVYGKLAECSAR